MVSTEIADAFYAFAFKQHCSIKDPDGANCRPAPQQALPEPPPPSPIRTEKTKIRVSPYFAERKRPTIVPSSPMLAPSPPPADVPPLELPEAVDRTPLATIAQVVPVQSQPQKKLIPHGASVIAFDTETSGWIKNEPTSNLVLQIAWAIGDDNGALVKGHERYCQLPRGVPITGIARKVHQISLDTVRTRGVNTKKELETFCDVVDEAKRSGVRVVAHNASFDVQAVNRTLRRWGSTRAISEGDVMCTMKRSGAVLGLRSKTGRARNPKNSELYEILFKEKAQGQLHTALADALITAKNFIGGLRKGWW